MTRAKLWRSSSVALGEPRRKNSAAASRLPQRRTTSSISRSRSARVGSQGSSGLRTNRGVVLIRTRAVVRSGYVAANRAQRGPPSPSPHRTARSVPAASITARMSSMRTSRVPPATRSDMPVPRLSNRSNRLIDARRLKNCACEGFSQTSSTWWVMLGMKTRSIGPSPTTW